MIRSDQLSGKRITPQQVSRCMNSPHPTNSQSKAAAKAGISDRAGRRIEKNRSIGAASLLHAQSPVISTLCRTSDDAHSNDST
jgi:hypothetical protein